MSRFINPVPQFFDDTGAILTAGTLEFFESGTATQISIYADVNLDVIIANPVILDAGGRVPNIFFPGTARVILKDQTGQLISDVDPIGDSSTGGGISTWSAIVVYNINEIVQGSDNALYRSETNANTNHDPITSGTFWAEVEFIEVWSTDVTYDILQTAKASDGSLYNSLINNNQGNDPVSSPSEWGTTGIAQTAGDIKTLYLSNVDTNNFDDAAESKLAAIEANATIDQTGAEIKTAYEGEANAFTDAQFTKLGNVEALADVTDTGNVTTAGALMDSELTSLSGVKTLTLDDNTTISTFAATLVDDTTAAAMRTTLDVDQAGSGASVVMQVFTSSGTYTPTSGMTHAIVEVQAGGGGGGGGNTTAAAAGGGSGGYGKSVITAATIGASQTVTIGAAGSAGSTSPSNGGAGGTSSLGSLISCAGGSGGARGNSTTGAAGGAGGAASSGDFQIDGAQGQGGGRTNGFFAGGSGAGAQLGNGGGGGGMATTVGLAGGDGKGYGAGGGGAGADQGTSAAGGAGGGGVIVITEHIA